MRSTKDASGKLRLVVPCLFLIVVDAVGQPHGMIHMHDILRAKIV